jgi:hypothetical protein
MSPQIRWEPNDFVKTSTSRPMPTRDPSSLIGVHFCHRFISRFQVVAGCAFNPQSANNPLHCGHHSLADINENWRA